MHYKLIGLTVLAFLMMFSAAVQAQFRFSGGGIAAGLGSFESSTPDVSSYLTAAYINVQYYSLPGIFFKPQVFYSRDVNILFPENRTGKYYPYIYGVSLSALSADSLSSIVTLEYGGGIVVLRDKTFSDLQNLSPGAQLSASLFFTAAHYSAARLMVGATVTYGQNFGKTTPSYIFYAVDCRLQR